MLSRLIVQNLTKSSRGQIQSSIRLFSTNPAVASSSNKGKYLVGGAAICGLAFGASVIEAKEPQCDVKAVRSSISELLDDDEEGVWGPRFVRLAWHSSGSYKKEDNSGGSRGGTIRFKPEIDYPGNAGLYKSVDLLEKVKKKHPEISYADLYVLAGITAIEYMGGPDIPFRTGRVDAKSGSECEPDDRLPGADKGSKPKTIQHIRDVFYRMGFNDREIVALIGAHALGRCNKENSGYIGAWTNAPTTFSNEFYKLLLDLKWKKHVLYQGGPEQYGTDDPVGKDLMMLPADMALSWDSNFRKYCELYAKDEDLWFEDFSKAFQKLTENGVDFDGKPWWKFWA